MKKVPSMLHVKGKKMLSRKILTKQLYTLLADLFLDVTKQISYECDTT